MITIFGSPSNVFARPIQIYSSKFGPDYCMPSGFGIARVDVEGRPLSWIIPHKAPIDEIISIDNTFKFKSLREAEDYLKTIEVK